MHLRLSRKGKHLARSSERCIDRLFVHVSAFHPNQVVTRRWQKQAPGQSSSFANDECSKYLRYPSRTGRRRLQQRYHGQATKGIAPDIYTA
ncbi:hypothetical protein MTO96_012009 [Rhipicephalus appendiculatus]